MKHILLGVVILVGMPILCHAAVLNVNNANNFAGGFSVENVPYVGQGVYPDPGNNTWNSFADGTATISNLVNSDGSPSPISVTTSESGNNSGGLFNSPYEGNPNTLQGTPGFLLGEAELTSNGGTTPVTVSLTNVPAGTYSLFLYGANYDQTRGAAFNILVGGGAPDNGFTSTLNNITAENGTPGNPAGQLSTLQFVEGANYVEFTGVTPVAGDITFTASQVNNTTPGGAGSGEGDFNGFQLVSAVPEPTSMMGLIGLVSAGLVGRRRRTNI
jgi:hypothetical protein